MTNYSITRPIPYNSVGVGLRSAYHSYILKNKPEVSWFEVHSENFFAKGGKTIEFLSDIRNSYPLSLHCVGLSLGSAQKVDKKHLNDLKYLVNKVEPFLVSDHISWSNVDGQVLNDLLPIPYTKESLNYLCQNIEQTQDFLQRQILVENPSTYLAFKEQDFAEYEFINEVVKRTGCKILLDVNNIYVSSQNNGFDPINYINNLDANIAGEMHLAGHWIKAMDNNKTMIIDTHDSKVCDEVWDLYKIAVNKFTNIPTLIEWDSNLPDFNTLLDEAKKAEIIIANKHEIS